MNKKNEGNVGKYLMKLHWLALEGIPDEAALASFRRNEGNVGKCAVAWGPGWLFLLCFWVFVLIVLKY